MIYGIGVDLVKIRRMDRVIQKWGDRFVERVFTPEEAMICRGRRSAASAFALRFAAKEAFSKALGVGMKKGVKWRDIEVFNEPSGKPGLRVRGTCYEFCRRYGVTGMHLSLSDEDPYAVAMVVLEKDEGFRE
jgi:holo-[acyl-carrier protein] synthase